MAMKTAALKSNLDAMHGAVAQPMAASRGFDPNVILKCDPDLAESLRERYSGVGHRSHLDRRFWISVSLDADVPAAEIKRLAAHSYAQVCAKLTRKQQAELARRQV